MGGTKDGAAKARETIKAKDPDFYKKIGAKGGLNTNQNKGFGSMDHERIVEVGRRGGTISRKGSKSSKFDPEAYMQRVKEYARRNQEMQHGA